MDKKSFYQEQAENFRDFSTKFHDRDLFSIFEEWAESKDIYGIDRHEIWGIARNLRPRQTRIINEGSEEYVRLSAVLDFLLEVDLAYFNKLAGERKNRQADNNKIKRNV